jgi:hypothetical protein
MPDEILAWEPGGTLEEALRHRQFRRLRQGLGEYFQIAPDLLKHCKTLRTLHGDPNADWPTTASVGRGRHRRATLPSELPLPRSTELATAAQASRLLGISDSTIRYWIASKRLVAVTTDERNRDLYFLDHIRHMADSRGARAPRRDEAV